MKGTAKTKEKRHQFLQAVSGMNSERKKKLTLAWILTLIWFLVGFGPFASIGNSLFSDPNNPALWVPFQMPSIWVWQLVFLGVWYICDVVSCFSHGTFRAY
ncbi:MAG: hypothetical protein CM1200mP10_22390 [Candidatus Neomarinimicrobiota bacterium]|nr:MAG: hypothetical protein CM1200mP10_22390 [Candidatus Neomarinimicrobiota bacterium]